MAAPLIRTSNSTGYTKLDDSNVQLDSFADSFRSSSLLVNSLTLQLVGPQNFYGSVILTLPSEYLLQASEKVPL